MSSSSAVLLIAVLAGSGPQAASEDIFQSTASPTGQNRIDDLVFARLDKLGIPPANLSSDAVFVRRAFLDAIGTLPTAAEASQFLADDDPQKRSKLIDRLLARREFADYRALKWGDLLRVKAEFPINLWPNAAQAYHRWIYDSIRENKPYDRFVRELLTSSGSNFRTPAVNFYRAVQGSQPEAIAEAVALTFLGRRADKWPKEQLAGMVVFFSQIGFKPTKEWKEEIVYFDIEKSLAGPSADAPQAVFPDGTEAEFTPGQDPRRVFADWLVRDDNRWFARNIVNRIWYWLLGRGIVHEPDDFRSDNQASNPELLDFLADELVAADYDLEHVYRLILNSQTYQLSSVPKSKDPRSAENFAFYPIRRLEAEVLIDALCQITGTGEKYSSQIPEPFTYIPESRRSIALADGSITSSFLEMFGRPPRDTGRELERDNDPTPSQRLHFLNSSHVQRKLTGGPKTQKVLLSNRSTDEIAKQIYLMILSRYPTERELEIVAEYSQSSVVKDREGLQDLAWALINSAEFLHRH